MWIREKETSNKKEGWKGWKNFFYCKFLKKSQPAGCAFK